jgi:hypothetical protein
VKISGASRSSTNGAGGVVSVMFGPSV